MITSTNAAARNPKQPQYRAGIGINHAAMRLIEYRHREFLPAAIVCQLTQVRQVARVGRGTTREERTSQAAGELARVHQIRLSQNQNPRSQLISPEIFTTSNLATMQTLTRFCQTKFPKKSQCSAKREDNVCSPLHQFRSPPCGEAALDCMQTR